MDTTSAVPPAPTIDRGSGFCQAKYTAGFSEVLQRIPGERKAIAADLGLPYGTLDNFIRGTQSFPPDLISRLFAVTGDWAIIRFILDPLGLQAVSKITPNRPVNSSNPDALRMLMDAVERIASALHEVRASKASEGDGGPKVSPSEYSRINYFLTEIERLAAQARECVKAEVE